ncbi:MAG: tetratricopeptide repeat protein [Candidatus Riflebacteria bacterium]|nr:tetratricopeptide repeat protein [Candidatus Riflebacteria bacterium]
METRKIEEIFERGVHYFRGGFFSAAFLEFKQVERLDAKYPNIGYFLEVARKKSEEIGGQLSSFIDENFDSEIKSLSDELMFEGSTELSPQIERLLNQERVHEALEKIENASLYVPDSKPLMLLKAKVFRKLGRLDEAEKILLRAKQLYPGNAEVLNGLGNLFLLRNVFSQAHDNFEAALKIEPDDRRIQNNLGVLKMQCNKLDEAFLIFKKLTNLWPGWAVAERNLTGLSRRIAQLDSEIDKLRAELALHPDYLDIFLSLAKNLLFRGFFSEARRHLLKIVEKNPSLWEAWFYLGTLQELEEEMEEAIISYKKMAEGKKRRNSNEFKTFTDLYNQGYLEESLVELKKVAILDFDPAARHITLGTRYFEDGLWAEALRHFQEAGEIAPYPDAHYWCGLAHLQLGKKTLAEKAFKKAIELNPRFADAQYQLGMLLKSKAPAKARHHLNSALALGLRKHFAILAKDFLESTSEK